MDSSTAGGLVNQILYVVGSMPDLGDATLARCADGITNQTHFKQQPAQYAEAINVVLRDGQLSDEILEESRFYSASELLDFLRRLGQRLGSATA